MSSIGKITLQQLQQLHINANKSCIDMKKTADKQIDNIQALALDTFYNTRELLMSQRHEKTPEKWNTLCKKSISFLENITDRHATDLKQIKEDYEDHVERYNPNNIRRNLFDCSIDNKTRIINEIANTISLLIEIEKYFASELKTKKIKFYTDIFPRELIKFVIPPSTQLFPTGNLYF